MSKRQSVAEMLGILAAAGMFGMMRRPRATVPQQSSETLFGVANAERAQERHRQKLARRLVKWNREGGVPPGGPAQ